MKNLLASTAIAMAFASPAFAAAHAESAFVPSASAEAVFASDLVGARLYTSEKEMDGEMEMNEADQEWDDVGEISDIVLDKGGDIRAVLVDIGGFLGIGEKTVAVSMDQLRFVSDGDDADEYFVVLKGNQAMFEDAPEFTFDAEADMEENAATAEVKTEEDTDGDTEMKADAEATTGSDNNTMATASKLPSQDRDYRFNAPTIERDGFSMAEADKLTTEDLTGAPLYDSNDEWIGEVHSVLLDESGKLGDAILDVGGFLGIGEKQVAVNFQELNLQRQNDGGELRVYIDATKEQLEELPEVDM